MKIQKLPHLLLIFIIIVAFLFCVLRYLRYLNAVNERRLFQESPELGYHAIIEGGDMRFIEMPGFNKGEVPLLVYDAFDNSVFEGFEIRVDRLRETETSHEHKPDTPEFKKWIIFDQTVVQASRKIEFTFTWGTEKSDWFEVFFIVSWVDEEGVEQQSEMMVQFQPFVNSEP